MKYEKLQNINISVANVQSAKGYIIRVVTVKITNKCTHVFNIESGFMQDVNSKCMALQRTCILVAKTKATITKIIMYCLKRRTIFIKPKMLVVP